MVIMEPLKSSKQEKFSRLIALDGLSISEAYKQSYNCENMKQDSIYQLSSRLAKQVKITSRIEALKATVTEKLASDVAWDRNRIVSELAVNVELAREHKQMAASNRSLELVAKITGSLSEETKQVTGTVSVIHSLSDAQLDQLASMATPEPVPIEDTGSIEASYKLLEAEPE